MKSPAHAPQQDPCQSLMHRWLETADHFYHGDNVPSPQIALPFEDSSNTPGGNLTSPVLEEKQVTRKDFHLEDHKEEDSIHKFIRKWSQTQHHFSNLDDCVLVPQQETPPFEDCSKSPNLIFAPLSEENRATMKIDSNVEDQEGPVVLVSNTAATRIQKAWRSMKKRRVTCKLQPSFPGISNESIRNTCSYDNIIPTNMSGLEHSNSEKVGVDEDHKEGKRSTGIGEEEPSRVEKVFKPEYIQENESYSPHEDLSDTPNLRTPLLDARLENNAFMEINMRSRPNSSTVSNNSLLVRLTSSSRKMQPENFNHSGKRIWWLPFTSGGKQTSKKSGQLPFKSSEGQTENTRLELVKKVGAFKLLEDHVLNAICEKLYLRVFAKSSKVFREKKSVDYVLFIIEGKLEYQGEDGTIGSIEHFCGEELLLWHYKRMGIEFSKAIPGQEYPLSNRIVQCLTIVEAFALDSDDLQRIMTKYREAFSCSRVQWAMRNTSPHRRSLAASKIQTAWRSRKPRNLLWHGEWNSPIVYTLEGIGQEAGDKNAESTDSGDKNAESTESGDKNAESTESGDNAESTESGDNAESTESGDNAESTESRTIVVEVGTKPKQFSAQSAEEPSRASSYSKESTGDKVDGASLASSWTECSGDKSNMIPESGRSTSAVLNINLDKFAGHSAKKITWRDHLAKVRIGWKRRTKPDSGNAVKKEDPIVQPDGVPKIFSHKLLREATGGFGDEYKIGSGGFGSTVYRGFLPSSSSPVAVKKMCGFSTAHGKGLQEFAAEVSIIVGHLKHENLLPVLGWSEDKARKEFLLVYELMPNGSLADALFETGKNGVAALLPWPLRFRIVIDIAEALAYLHDEDHGKSQVIHGDVKPSNILLDKEWNAKLGDVGLAPLVHQHSETCSTTAVTRTTDDNMILSSQKHTDKADVCAFGAVVLEVCCGRRAISDSVPPEEEDLVDWVWNCRSRGNLLSTVDELLGETYDAYSMEVLLRVGLLCSHPDPLARPSMKDVIQVLAGEAQVPSIPMAKPTPEWTVVPATSVDPANDKLDSSNQVDMVQGIPQRFSYEQLSMATKGFSKESKLGQGGFGSVYQGVLPPSNIPVAVKKMDTQWAKDQGVKEFMAEVSIISRLRHRNLIELFGWCENAAKKEYLLVYELMRNGSLDDVLFDESGKDSTGRCSLNWSQRFNILKGTAAAVDYLHRGWKRQVIHRDIKCSNIMLDEDWNPQLGDFGLARMVDHRGGAANTVAAGTMGYIAPEVLADGHCTDKSDVFGFGAVVLEVACGRRVWAGYPHKMGVVDWVWHCLLNKGDLLSAVDGRLGDYDRYWMKALLMVGLLCSHPNPSARPSMRQVVLVFNGDVPVPSIPASKPTPVFPSVPHTLSIHDIPDGESFKSTSELMVSTEVPETCASPSTEA